MTTAFQQDAFQADAFQIIPAGFGPNVSTPSERLSISYSDARRASATVSPRGGTATTSARTQSQVLSVSRTIASAARVSACVAGSSRVSVPTARTHVLTPSADDHTLTPEAR